jgi:hypothetical protein
MPEFSLSSLRILIEPNAKVAHYNNTLFGRKPKVIVFLSTSDFCGAPQNCSQEGQSLFCSSKCT